MLEEMPVEIPEWIRKRFPPGQRSAVDFLRQLVDEGMLKEIAEVDCTQEAEQQLSALKPIWLGGELKALNPWFPMEALELMQWSEPEDPTWTPGPTDLRGHTMRAFCCAVLLATPNFEPNKETLIQMLDSVFLIGREAAEATGRFLTWRIDSLGHEEDRPFFALALAAVLQFLDPEMPVSREEELAGWVRDEESSERNYLAGFSAEYKTALWLFGLSFIPVLDIKWEALIRKIQEKAGDRPLGRLLAKHHKA